MNYSVLLVQRGISAQTHPVSGKSGKNYGTAVVSPQHKGVIFKMSLDDYFRDMHDLIGNTQPVQQWVPEFVTETASSPGDRPECCIPAGCHLGPNGQAADATHIWNRFVYCHQHAPSNAKPLYADSPALAVVQASPPTAPAPVVEKAPALVEGPTDLPRQEFAPPPVGSETPEQTPGPKAVPEPQPPQPEMRKPPAPPAGSSGPGAPHPPPQQSAVEIIKAVVGEAMAPVIERLDKLESGQMAGKKKRKALGGPNLAPTAFRLLQQEAKGLGINVYGMGKEALEKAVAEKKSNLAAANASDQ